MLRATNCVTFSQDVEDRAWFDRPIPDNYGTKLAIENRGMSVDALSVALRNYPDLYIIFALRHPVDNCLSKIVRGQPRSKGGDTGSEVYCDDADREVSVRLVKTLYDWIASLQEMCPDRVLTVRMEDIILRTEDTVRDLCEQFNIEFYDTMLDFAQNNRNRYQKGRYGNSLSTSQVNIYRQLQPFDNWFAESDTIEWTKQQFEVAGLWKKYYTI